MFFRPTKTSPKPRPGPPEDDAVEPGDAEEAPLLSQNPGASRGEEGDLKQASADFKVAATRFLSELLRESKKNGVAAIAATKEGWRELVKQYNEFIECPEPLPTWVPTWGVDIKEKRTNVSRILVFVAGLMVIFIIHALSHGPKDNGVFKMPADLEQVNSEIAQMEAGDPWTHLEPNAGRGEEEGGTARGTGYGALDNKLNLKKLTFKDQQHPVVKQHLSIMHQANQRLHSKLGHFNRQADDRLRRTRTDLTKEVEEHQSKANTYRREARRASSSHSKAMGKLEKEHADLKVAHDEASKEVERHAPLRESWEKLRAHAVPGHSRLGAARAGVWGAWHNNGLATDKLTEPGTVTLRGQSARRAAEGGGHPGGRAVQKGGPAAAAGGTRLGG